MATAVDDGFKLELKRMIVEETGKSEVDPAQITDDEALFGPEAPLELDSLDGLQISVALKQRYGVEINDSKVLRRVMRNIETLADYLHSSA